MGSYANILRENTSTFFDGELDLPVLEGYGSSDGYLISMAEGLYNENADFNDSMLKEFREAALEMKKSDLESQGLFEEAANVQVVTEGASDIIEKLKELIRKLGAKINSIYEAVKTRVMSFLTRDYNKFYTKNKDKFTKKYKNFKGNIKWMSPKNDFTSGLKFNNLTGKINTTFIVSKDLSKEQIEKANEELKDGTFLDNLLCSVCPNTDRKDFKKDFKELLFDDKDKVEGVSDDVYKEVSKILGTKDIIKNLNDAQKKNKELFKTTLKTLDTISSSLSKGESHTSYSKDKSGNNEIIHYKESDSKKVALTRSRVLALQTACNMINGEYISLTKRHIAQCKAVFTKVVASGVKEQVLLDSIEECAYVEGIEELEA